jgi:hypothetical protein
MSTSRSRSTGEDFTKNYSNNLLSHPVLLEMKLTGKGGKDISYFSQAQKAEDEVLLLPGTKFKIDSSKMIKLGDLKVEHLVATEVAGDKSAVSGTPTSREEVPAKDLTQEERKKAEEEKRKHSTKR